PTTVTPAHERAPPGTDSSNGNAPAPPTISPSLHAACIRSNGRMREKRSTRSASGIGPKYCPMPNTARAYSSPFVDGRTSNMCATLPASAHADRERGVVVGPHRLEPELGGRLHVHRLQPVHAALPEDEHVRRPGLPARVAEVESRARELRDVERHRAADADLELLAADERDRTGRAERLRVPRRPNVAAAHDVDDREADRGRGRRTRCENERRECGRHE